MIFNGGMISSYVVNTQFLNLKNSIWALILPLCVSSFNVVICKTFFKTNIPESIIESAQIDGATQFQIFGKIALPLSKPLMATIALFLTFGYWNDWFQSSLYISDTKLYSLQALLDHVQRNIEMMANNPSLGVTTAQYMNSMPKEGARMAMAIIIIIPIACCYPFFQKYFISGPDGRCGKRLIDHLPLWISYLKQKASVKDNFNILYFISGGCYNEKETVFSSCTFCCYGRWHAGRLRKQQRKQQLFKE